MNKENLEQSLSQLDRNPETLGEQVKENSKTLVELMSTVKTMFHQETDEGVILFEEDIRNALKRKVVEIAYAVSFAEKQSGAFEGIVSLKAELKAVQEGVGLNMKLHFEEDYASHKLWENTDADPSFGFGHLYGVPELEAFKVMGDERNRIRDERRENFVKMRVDRNTVLENLS